MPSSLIKYTNRTERNGQRLFWQRADVDGFPFRGPHAPFIPEEEYEHRVVRVVDFKNGFFDITKPEENQAYCDVMEGIANGWFQLRHQTYFWNNSTSHYIEWLEYFMEDGSRVPALTGGVMEGVHGPANGTGSPFQG